jgi:hypothetical protein
MSKDETHKSSSTSFDDDGNAIKYLLLKVRGNLASEEFDTSFLDNLPKEVRSWLDEDHTNRISIIQRMRKLGIDIVFYLTKSDPNLLVENQIEEIQKNVTAEYLYFYDNFGSEFYKSLKKTTNQFIAERLNFSSDTQRLKVNKFIGQCFDELISEVEKDEEDKKKQERSDPDSKPTSLKKGSKRPPNLIIRVLEKLGLTSGIEQTERPLGGNYRNWIFGDNPIHKPSSPSFVQVKENKIESSKNLKEVDVIDEVDFYKRLFALIDSKGTISLDQFDEFAYAFQKAINRGEIQTLEEQQMFIEKLENELGIVTKQDDAPSDEEIRELARISMELAKTGKISPKSIVEAYSDQGLKQRS